MTERRPLVLVNGDLQELPSGDTLPGDRQHNFAASVNPATSDDDAAGYSVGSLWVNTTADTAFICVDSTGSAAVWVDITQSGGGGGLQNKYDGTAGPGATDDTNAGYSVGSIWVDITNDKAYIALDVTASAAVWTEITQTGGGASGPQNNFAATAAPAVGDDDVDGYEVGSVWIDVTNDNAYTCVDATTGAAVWVQTNGAGGGSSTFTGLSDTPANFTGQALKALRVNAGETDLEFTDFPSGAPPGMSEVSELQIAHSSPVPSTGWTALGLGTPNIREYNSTTKRYTVSNNVAGLSGAVQPVTGTAWTRILKVYQPYSSGGFNFNGVVVTDSVTDNHVTFGLFRTSVTFYAQIWLNNSFDSEASVGGAHVFPGRNRQFLFYKIERDADDLHFSVSADGLQWYLIHTKSISTDLGGAADGVGIVVNNTNTDLNQISILGFDSVQQDQIVIGVKNQTQSEITAASYSTVDDDFVGNVIRRMNSASAQTITVEPSMTNQEPVTFIAAGAGAVSFAAGTGVTIHSAGGNLTIADQYGSATLIPDTDTAETYYLIGNLTT